MLTGDPVEQPSNISEQIVVAARVGAFAGIQEFLQALCVNRLKAFHATVVEKSIEQPKLAIFAGELASHGAFCTQVLFDLRG